ncbi:MAG: hypothetical protein ACKVP6_11760 [Mycobacterium sp.]
MATSDQVRADQALLATLAERVRPVAGAGERLLPVVDDLVGLVPQGGLRRGSIIDVDAPAVLFRLLAAPTSEGFWAAVVGRPELGWAAAAELGVALDHVAVVAVPPRETAGTVLAALVDAVDVVVAGPVVVSALRAADARRITARARERGAVLFVDGRWPEAVDMRWRVAGVKWSGLGEGWGHLQRWEVEVLVDGRGAAARPRRGWVALAVNPIPSPGLPDGLPGDGPVPLLEMRAG